MSKALKQKQKVSTNTSKGSVCKVDVPAITFSQLWNNYVTGNPYNDPSGTHTNQCAMTILCWGLLYLYGSMYLQGRGSLFDTNPEIANLFFIVWGCLSGIASLACVCLVRRWSKKVNAQN